LWLDGKFLLLPQGRKAVAQRIHYQTKNSVTIKRFVENNLAFALVGFVHFIWACG
jgi:hypothetical protein